MKPSHNINGNPNWRYRSADETDIKKTFARLKKEAEAQRKAELEQIQKMPAQWARRA